MLNTTINIGDAGIEVPVSVEYKYYPGFPGQMYRANGDPGDPPEPAEVEIMGIYVQNEFKNWVPIPEWLMLQLENNEELQEKLWELCELDWHDERAQLMAERFEGDEV